jgi:hypothetical protein
MYALWQDSAELAGFDYDTNGNRDTAQSAKPSWRRT